MASRAGHCEVAEFLLQSAAPVDAKAKVFYFVVVFLYFSLTFN